MSTTHSKPPFPHILRFTISKLEIFTPSLTPLTIQIQYADRLQSLTPLTDPRILNILDESVLFKVQLPLKEHNINILIKNHNIFSSVVASCEVNLQLVPLPFCDWISLEAKTDSDSQLYARILLKASLERSDNNAENDEDQIFCATSEEQNQVQGTCLTEKRDWVSLLKKGLQPYISSLVTQTLTSASTKSQDSCSLEEIPPAAFNVNDYGSKMYIFGDDGAPKIMEFDFITETFRELPVPKNLQLFGYSMSLGLPNGKIVITGGINKNLNTIVPTAFWYDPVTNTAKVLPNFDQPRYTHSMAFVNGSLYIIGGRYYGKDINGVLCHCERFDLNRNQWVRVADLKERRCTASATTYKDHIYIFGGYQGTGRLKSIEKYFPKEDRWEVLSLQMPIAIEAGFCESLGDGRIVYIGGKDDTKPNATVNVYNMETLQMESAGKLKQTRVLSKHSIYKDKLFIFGGKNLDWETASFSDWNFEVKGEYKSYMNSELKLYSYATTSEYIDLDIPQNHGQSLYLFGNPNFPKILEYSIKDQLWYQRALPTDMRLQNNMMTVALPNGYIMVFGGHSNTSCSKNVYLYNPMKKSILLASQMNCARYGSAVVQKDGFVYVLGGRKPSGNIGYCERYNIKSNQWEELADMIEARYGATVQVVNDEIYVFGGFKGKDDIALQSMEKYCIVSNTWKILPETIPFKAKKIFSFMLNSEEAVIFGQNYDQQVRVNLRTLEVNNDEKILPKAPQFTHFIYNHPKLYIFEGKSVYSLEITKEGKVKSQWCLTSSTVPIQDLKNLVNCSVAHKLEIEGKQPLGLFDELALTNTSSQKASMFIFVNEQDNQKIMEFDLNRTQFNEIAVPQGMRINRHAAAVGLPNASILLTGGISLKDKYAYVNNTTVLYSPWTNTYQEKSPMSQCRYEHGAVFYKGNAYVIGGREFYSNSQSYLKECEKLNMKTGEWEAIPALNTERSNAAVCCINDYIYVIGGRNQAGLLCDIERYKEGGQWEVLEDFSLPYPLEGAVAVTLSYDQIYLFGGMTLNNSSNEVVVLHPLIKHVEVGSKYMIHHRHLCKAVAHGDKIFTVGGSLTGSSEMSSVEGTSNWKTISSYEHIIESDLRSAAFAMSRVDMDLNLVAQQYEKPEYENLYVFGTELNRKIIRLSLPEMKWEAVKVPENLKLWDYSVAIMLPNGKIFLTGGINYILTDIKTTAYLLDFSKPEEEACEALALMSQGRYTHTSCYSNNYVYVMGGRYYGNGQAGVLSHCERYHMVTKRWEVIAPLKGKRCTGVATTYLNRVYMFGGYRGDGRVMTIERYNEAVNVWEIVPLLLLYPIEAEGMIRLSESEIVLLGGKDDFSEQGYVSVYNLEKMTARMEKNMIAKRILSKTARYNDEIIVVGGNAQMTCEKAKIGEWEWNSFESYSKFLTNNLTKSAAAQGK